MPIAREVLETQVAALNAKRPKDMPAKLEAVTEKGFTLSFPDRALPDGQCIDQDFTDIQWMLHELGITTGIVNGRLDEDEARYHMQYEIVEWD